MDEFIPVMCQVCGVNKEIFTNGIDTLCMDCIEKIYAEDEE